MPFFEQDPETEQAEEATTSAEKHLSGGLPGLITIGVLVAGGTMVAYAWTPAPDSRSAGFVIGMLTGLITILIGMPRTIRRAALILGLIAAIVTPFVLLSR